jgi:hypothetical protein
MGNYELSAADTGREERYERYIEQRLTQGDWAALDGVAFGVERDGA